MAAVAAAAVVSAAGIVGAVGAAGSLQDNGPPMKPADSARATAAAAERARADLTAEMAQHADWPQRPVEVRDANASPERTVEVTYTVTRNQDVLDAVARIKRDYGSMVVVQPQRSHTPASKPGVAVKSGGAG